MRKWKQVGINQGILKNIRLGEQIVLKENIIEVKNLSKKYGKVTAVNQITFKVQKGEIFGLLGPNGAGKTTTISMIAGLIRSNTGKINVKGYDISLNLTEVKNLIGIVPQEISLYNELSAKDNLIFFGKLYGVKGKTLKENISKVLEIFGLSKRSHENIQNFSGGMKRRLNIAVGLIHKPEILFLDEPTVGVDPQSRYNIFENVKKLANEGITIIYTTHYMEEAEMLCNRVGIIDDGKIIALDTPKQLINNYGKGFIYIGIDNIDANVLNKLNNLTTIKSISKNDSKLCIEAMDIQNTLIDIITMLKKFNLSITSLEILEPSLESVFLHLTKKSLRD